MIERHVNEQPHKQISGENGARAATQIDLIKRYTLDREWVTLRDISEATGCIVTSASARLRALRKMGYVVDREHLGNGHNVYRVRAPEQGALFDAPAANKRLTNREKRRARFALESAWVRLTDDERQALEVVMKFWTKGK